MNTVTETKRASLHGMWDPSIVGVTPDDKAEMEPHEQAARLIEEIDRAADLAEHSVACFSEHVSDDERVRIEQAVAMLIAARRSMVSRY